MSEVEGTSDMPECVRKVLEQYQCMLVPPIDEVRTQLLREIDRDTRMALQVRLPTKIIITDIA